MLSEMEAFFFVLIIKIMIEDKKSKSIFTKQ